MSSSTSSSDTAEAAAERGPKRVAVRTLVAGILLLGSGLLVTRCATWAFDWVLLEDTRVREALDHFREIAAAPEPVALVFGSSLTYVGFSPEVFDARLEEHGVAMQSYNLGFGGLNPSLQTVLARRVREAFEEEGRKASLTLVEFTPFQATAARRRAQARGHEQSLMMLATPLDIARLTTTSPEQAARTLTVRYLRASLTAEAMTNVLGGVATVALSALLPDVSPPSAERSPEELQAQREVQGAFLGMLIGLFRVYGGKPDPWDPAFRGELRLDFPETREHVERLMRPTPMALQADLDNRIRCCDIVDLGFDPELIRDFIVTVLELAAISDRVVVVLLPKNTDWVVNPPEALERQRGVLAQIERETGVPVLDLQVLPGFDGWRFLDVTHLTSLEGKPAFSRLLADRCAPLLRDGAP